MLYVLYGTDTIKARVKLKSLLDTLHKRKPDASLVRVDDETFENQQLDELMYGQGLFEKKYIVVFDKVFLNEEAKKCILENIQDIAKSSNIFIFFEEKVDKKTLVKLEKHAEKVQAFIPNTATAVKKPFDIFSLTDALGRRDRKHLWILYQKAKHNNISDEEIHGILFWQTKSMLLAVSAKSAVDAGLKPFVFQKARTFCKNYTKRELEKLSASLIAVYHDARRAPLGGSARRGIHEFPIAMEQFVLNI